MLDILFVSEVTLIESMIHPYIGQLILRDIVSENYTAEILTVDSLQHEKNIPFERTVDDTLRAMTEYIIDREPKIIDFYTVCDTFPLTIALAENVKAKLKDSVVIFAGPHASLLVEECLKELPFVDIVAYTEGEKMIEKLVDNILAGNDLSDVQGIAYRSGKKIIKTEAPSLISSDELHQYFVKDFYPYYVDSRSEIELEGGRGCPFGCTFCSTSLFWKRKARMKPIKDLLEEMQYYFNKYGSYKFFIVHDLFTSNYEYILEFCDTLINENKGFEWTCSSRLDTIDENLLKRMALANCTGMYIGIETGSRRLQKVLHKNLELSRVIPIAKICKNMGIDIVFSLIIGFPEETLEDFRETINLAEQILLVDGANNILQIHMFSPYPATVETEKIEKKLHFPNNKAYLPITQRICLNSRTEDIVGKYPKLCSSYLNFDSEIRNHYCMLPLFIEIVEHLKKVFRFSLLRLVSKYGICDMYEHFLNIYNDENCDMYDEQKYNANEVLLMKNIIREYGEIVSDDEKEVFTMEILLADMMLSDSGKYKILKTDIDFLEARKDGNIVKGNNKYLFFGKKLDAKVIEYNNLKFEEALIKSGYEKMND